MIKDFYQIHLQFQNFMISKGYSVREREKLISPVFPTTFTMSGGPDLAYKFWQGDKSLLGNQIVNQPCIRHWDIELTGDRKHLSFFNMFVADSIDGYSRKEIISHFYEFFTEYLHLDPSRFFASYFGGGDIKGTYFPPDNELKEIWKSLNIDHKKIIPFGDKYGMEAFVANTIEPVGGPRGELFYDLRDNPKPVESPVEFLKLDKTGEILEFCTHVLYNVEVKIEERNQSEPIFHFRKMNKEAIAVGFGPQRILTIIEGVNDVRDISILKSLKKCLGLPSDNFRKETTIVADHIRGLVFLINDGVLELHGQKNRSRRYLFRKYFKHFKENFDKLPLRNKSSVLECLVNESIELFSILFPEFSKKRKFIQEKIIQIFNALEVEVKEIRTEKDLENFLKAKKVEYRFIDRPESKGIEEIVIKTGLKSSQIAKSLILKDENNRGYLVIIRGDTKLDIKKLKEFLKVNKLGLVSKDEAVKYSGYLTGATPPLSHRLPMKVIIDKKILENKKIIAGGGSRVKLVELKVQDILELNEGVVADISD